MPFEYWKWAAMIDDDLVLRAKAFVNSVEAGAPPASIEAFLPSRHRAGGISQPAAAECVIRRFDGLPRHQREGKGFSSLAALRDRQRLPLRRSCRAGKPVDRDLQGDHRKPRFGAPMRARFAQFFEFRDGLIWRLRNTIAASRSEVEISGSLTIAQRVRCYRVAATLCAAGHRAYQSRPRLLLRRWPSSLRLAKISRALSNDAPSLSDDDLAAANVKNKEVVSAFVANRPPKSVWVMRKRTHKFSRLPIS